jgi:uncharacterized protein (TIGR00255 family)
MTGLGEASLKVEGVHYFAEVRSLNNKYFKGVIRLPEEYQALEAELESRLRERLTRGTVTLTISAVDETASAAHEINRGALSRYLAQLRQVPEVADGQIRLDLGALLALPGVLRPPGNEEDRLHRARAAFLQLTDRAVEGLLAMRQREGETLVRDLRAQGTLIADRLAHVRAAAPGVVAEYERRLKQRIEALLREAEARVDPGDLIREIAVYAEKTDIAEEIARLTGHLEQFHELLAADGGRPVGRTLDFLAQEMLREANTIASKSPDAGISRAIVEVKGAIDRIKEQAQNVE